MGTPALPDELAQQAADAFLAHNGNKTYAADSLGLARNTYCSRLRVAAQRGLLASESDPAVSAGMDAVGTAIVPHGMWIKTGKDEDGVSRSIYIKPQQEAPEDVLQRIREVFEGMEPAKPVAAPESADEDTLTIYPIADAHLGLKAMADEAGAESDLEIAAERFRNTTARLFARSPNSGTALILQLGDWTHADDDLAMTPTSKHVLQVSDGQLPVIRCGVRLMVDYIYHALTKHQRVIVKVIRGNHDRNAWITLYVALSEHFRGNDRVSIDGGAADYWFFRFGSTLIGAHHGHRLKPAEMAGAMATECREDWGETLYRLFLHGHLHHMIVQEVLGVRVECFRTLAEVDAHHAGKYGSGKSLVSITIHRENGEDGRAQINLPPIKKRAARP